MIGAMPAVAVRHERRKNIREHPDAEPGLLHGPSKNIRPRGGRGGNLLKSQLTSPSPTAAASTSGLSLGADSAAPAANASLVPSSSCGGHERDSHLLSAPPPSASAAAVLATGGSLANSRAGSPVAADPAVVLMYGDECCYAKVSLLHFIVFFFLGGITVMIIGAVQVNIEPTLRIGWFLK